ncbi:MAG: helix-turn-helix transcriptional regulator [Burkholderiales bacterium]|nr:helix-turn-helix transcriptional regulator [Burkholderiales bacterium]
MPHRSSDSVQGERLRALRLAKHLDVVVLARKVNLSSAQLRQLESGEHSLFYAA